MAVISPWLWVVFFAAGGVYAQQIEMRAQDQAFYIHGFIFFAFCIAGVVLTLREALRSDRYKRPADRGGVPVYNEGIVRAGVIASTFWGIIGFTVGLWLALQLSFPVLNFDLPWTNFGRLRPLHTSAVIFAFGGNVLIATSFYVVQRTCRTRLAGNIAPWFVFWGYQLFLVLAASGYLLGVTQSKEYAEPEWYVDIWLTLVWVTYLLVFMATLARRKEPHIYVANWFYLAFIVTIAMLHLVNNATIPVSFFGSKSYIAWSGVQDALTQWWYGHNAVGLLLSPVDHPFLGADLSLYLGRSASSALHRAPRLGADPGHDVLDHAVDAVLGRDDQRPDDPVRRVGQIADRSCLADAGGVCGVLRHEHLRRPADVGEGRERAEPLH